MILYLSEALQLSIVAALGVLGGGGTIGAVLVKRMNRPLDQAEIEAKKAAAKKDDLLVLREVITELRTDKAEANVKIESLERRDADREERVKQLEKRMTQQETRLEERDTKIWKLEERERHALTRAAVHEAWDSLTYGLLVVHHPGHPPPPPIRDPRAITSNESVEAASEVPSQAPSEDEETGP